MDKYDIFNITEHYTRYLLCINVFNKLKFVKHGDL